MSVCIQADEDSCTDEPGAGAPVREMYEQKAESKLVRVLTVLAYLLFVSLAAILLSVYYVWVWKSPELPPLDDTGGNGDLGALRADLTDYAPNYNDTYNYSGRSNTTVSDEDTASTPTNITSLPDDASESPVSESPATEPQTSPETEATDVIGTTSTSDGVNAT